MVVAVVVAVVAAVVVAVVVAVIVAVAVLEPAFEAQRSCLKFDEVVVNIVANKGQPGVVIGALVVAVVLVGSGLGRKSDSVVVGAVTVVSRMRR